ncbi:MAG: acetyl-CoA carboxylase biotin carboxyl carrier protein subunit, partial [Duncaniella sp.]|nr:acetyl-CoA carboxylase biotin carboxyl carrier protein subunit [Duncaniella sp.]
PGQEVKLGDTVMVYEAMKMENDIESEISGVVKRVLVDIDDQVATGTALIEFEG